MAGLNYSVLGGLMRDASAIAERATWSAISLTCVYIMVIGLFINQTMTILTLQDQVAQLKQLTAAQARQLEASVVRQDHMVEYLKVLNRQVDGITYGGK